MSSKAKKAARILIKLVSTAGTGFFYVTEKNARRHPDKLKLLKHDPKVNKHVLFVESKVRNTTLYTLANTSLVLQRPRFSTSLKPTFRNPPIAFLSILPRRSSSSQTPAQHTPA